MEKALVDEKGAITVIEKTPDIYRLIGKAMQKVGAIGKDSTATNNSGKQMYKFRGIDAVYNALNPVMAELGLFICPEVLEQTREERKSSTGGTLIYSILKIRFTMYAPDGSNVSCVVIGEGMDSGDKASNKAMSIALKYACFELFMIPTEEMVDPDAEVHEVAPKNTPAKRTETPVKQDAPAQVNNVPSVPPKAQETPANPVLTYLAKQRQDLQNARNISKAENAALWNKQVDVLKGAGKIPNKALSEYTQTEAEQMVAYMYSLFTPTGTELKKFDGKTA